MSSLTCSRLLSGAIGCLLFLGTISGAVAEPRNMTIRSIGEGPSLDEAKADAIKRAMQQAFTQLVVVDRVISGDEVLRDRVLSTSNGYVEKYQQRSFSEVATGFRIEADITLSASRIENFLGIVAGGGGQVDASLFGKELERREAQDKAIAAQGIARGEIFDRIFENYPAAAIEVSLKSAKLSDPDGKKLLLDFQLVHNESFIRSLKGTLTALSLEKCSYSSNHFPRILSKVDVCSVSRGRADDFMTTRLPQSTLLLSYAMACVSDSREDKTDCYLLDHGAYFWTGLYSDKPIPRYGRRYSQPVFAVYGRFEDKAGQSAMKNGVQCIAVKEEFFGVTQKMMGVERYQSIGSRYTLASQRLSRANRDIVLGLDVGPKQFKGSVAAEAVHLDRAVSFVAVAVALESGQGQRRSLGLTAFQDQARNPCTLVENASQRIRALPDGARK